MPFISSVRGNFGTQSHHGKRPTPGTGTTGGTITTAGGYRIHTFTSVGASTFTPDRSGDVEVYVWGAGGGASQAQSGWTQWSAGGGGGYASGTFQASARAYQVFVGQGGPYNNSVSCCNFVQGGGAYGTSWGNGSGGGLSGLFDNNSFTQGNAIVIAGGGGGGGTSRSGSTGTSGSMLGAGGGGTTGQNATNPYDPSYAGLGGTQSGGGANPVNGNNGYSPTFPNGGVPSPHGPGGGGGYYGGSGGGYNEPSSMSGAGGGSGYYNSSLVRAQTLTQGNYWVPANNSGSIYTGSYGNGGTTSGATGTQGYVVIRYLI
jgi:hypothetical protein